MSQKTTGMSQRPVEVPLCHQAVDYRFEKMHPKSSRNRGARLISPALRSGVLASWPPETNKLSDCQVSLKKILWKVVKEMETILK